jgi:hypothetical protein
MIFSVSELRILRTFENKDQSVYAFPQNSELLRMALSQSEPSILRKMGNLVPVMIAIAKPVTTKHKVIKPALG